MVMLILYQGWVLYLYVPVKKRPDKVGSCEQTDMGLHLGAMWRQQVRGGGG